MTMVSPFPNTLDDKPKVGIEVGSACNGSVPQHHYINLGLELRHMRPVLARTNSKLLTSEASAFLTVNRQDPDITNPLSKHRDSLTFRSTIITIHTAMAARSRAVPVIGALAALGGGYYLYTAGGDTSVAKKQAESKKLSHHSRFFD